MDLDVVAKWLNIEKGKLVKTLRESYVIDIDYVVCKAQKPNIWSKGGNNYKKVLLTPDCFKRLCMRSRSAKSEEVRTYFIQLESLIIKYHTYIEEGMNREIKQMEKELVPKSEGDSAGYIYILKASEEKDSVYKIGRTGDLNKRLATYNTGSLEGVDMIYKFRTDSQKAIETCLKQWLKEYQLRKYKEVYQVNIDMIKEVLSRCNDIANWKIEYVNKKSKMTGGFYVALAPCE
jgi:phage anti-repressor protein/predicted GIY-YIG superfamily endonuclease